MTRVVNLRKEPFDVYVGRPGKGMDGTFGNPIKKDEECFVCHETHTDATSTIACFKQYFLYRVEHDLEFREKTLALKGKTLGCFCKPSSCHGDVLVEWLDSVISTNK